MPDQIGPTTPESLVEAVYATFPGASRSRGNGWAAR